MDTAAPSTRTLGRVCAAVAAVVLIVAVSVARASLTASYDGQVRFGRKQRATVVGAFVESNGAVTGSVDIALADARGGVFQLTGVHHGRHVVLRGANVAGSRLTWHATIRSSSELSGVASVRLRHRTMRTSLVLETRPVKAPSEPPTTCDSTYFDDVVMPQVLVPICGRCHVPGGIAEAANFRVTASDPTATQASVALNIDTADPSASRILQKPLALIPHGGGQQIVPGSNADQILRHWVDIVASGQCGGGSGGGTGNPGLDLYDANCASCHGADARGVGGKPDIHCSRGIAYVVRTGFTGGPAGDMPTFPNLTDADVATLQAYLDGLCPSPSGADLYAGNCTSCHGGDGGGTSRAPTARCATRVADALAVGRAAAMPAFTPAFGPDDVASVQQYLDGLCTQFGVTGADLFASNCSTCHGANAGGGQNAFGAHGPDIRCYDPADFYEAVQYGTESMPPFALDTDRIAKIVTWVRAACGG